MDLKRILPFIIDEIPMGIVAMDVERRIVLVNRAMEALIRLVEGRLRAGDILFP